MSDDWLARLRKTDPEAAAIIDEQRRVEAIGARVLLREAIEKWGAPVGLTITSWGECARAAERATPEDIAP